MPSIYKNVIFDVSEVLLHGLKNSHKLVSPHIGGLSDEIIWQIHREVGQIETTLFCGRESEDEYFDRLLRSAGWFVSREEFKHLVRRSFGPIEGTLDIAKELRAKQFRLGLLSDHVSEWVLHCAQAFGHHEHFDAWVYSYEIGVCKPDAKAFAKILERLGATASESIFIDDNPRNITGAEALGIKGVLFTSAMSLRQDLRKLGIDL